MSLTHTTRRGKLAPISGSIDATDPFPTAAAKREIREETGLYPDQALRLDFVGPPFSFADHDAGRSWTVHPFGWTLLAPEAAIELDWEHDGWEWVNISDILETETGDSIGRRREECVPRIEESLRRVYHGPGGIFGHVPTMYPTIQGGKAFQEGLTAIRNDFTNGARVLATRAAECLLQVSRVYSTTIADNEKDLRSLWRWLRIAGWHLIHSARPSMNAAISSAVLVALQAVNKVIRESRLEEALPEVVKTLEEIISNRQSIAERTSQAFVRHVLPTDVDNGDNGLLSVDIITLSSSSTIKGALLGLISTLMQPRTGSASQPVVDPSPVPQSITVNITILESRPACEGASLAAQLIRAVNELNATDSELPELSSTVTMNITLVPDCEVAQVIVANTDKERSEARRPHYLLLGADRISAGGSVLNKTGSLAAAVLAKTLGRRTTEVVVISDCDKITAAKTHHEERARHEKEAALGDRDKAAGEPSEEDLTTHALESDTSHCLLSSYTSMSGFQQDDVSTIQRMSASDAQGGEYSDPEVTVNFREQVSTFEWVPSKYLDTYLTEVGAISKEQIKERSISEATLSEKMFEGLYDNEEDLRNNRTP